ncbi:MAG TPA: MBL fold metallo-hydrolase [Candidatus Limnocylindrales bacterium]|nr:MBL fold metallo-hydrolase [Candidatus Limnocylindrales bacterium]
MPINDSVDWSIDLGGGTRVGLIQAGTFRSDAGALFGPVPRMLWHGLVSDEIDREGRLLQALNCLLVESAAGRLLIETGIGERIPEKVRDIREYEGPAIVPALVTAGFSPETVDAVALTHLHFDHAGGLLRSTGEKAFPKARIVAQQAEWEMAFDRNSRIVASYDQPELRLVRDWGKEGWASGEVEIMPGVTVVPTGGHSKGHQAVIVRGAGGRAAIGGQTLRGARSRTLAFLGDLGMRPWSANPRWVTSFDDFPLDSVAAKGVLFERAVAEGWTIVLSHEPKAPVGKLVVDRDRYRFQPI